MTRKELIADFEKEYNTKNPDIAETIGGACISALYQQGQITPLEDLIRLARQAISILKNAQPDTSDPFDNWRNGGRTDG